jgi:hypothetical protein
MFNSTQALEFMKKNEGQKFFILVMVADCAPCSLLKDDIIGGALKDLGVELRMTELDFLAESDSVLVSTLNAQSFPFLALVNEARVVKRWVGYPENEATSRIAELRKLISEAWSDSKC